MSIQDQQNLGLSLAEPGQQPEAQKLNPVIRYSFRIRLGPEDRSYLSYQGLKFQLSNLSEHGLQLESNANFTFNIGQILTDIQLDLGSQWVTVTAQVVYYFQHSPNRFLYGLDILSFGSSEEKELLQTFLRHKKHELFSC
ncbi:MAG: PilZ domain-containing protein [Desulfohalobiaceae bacterium]